MKQIGLTFLTMVFALSFVLSGCREKVEQPEAGLEIQILDSSDGNLTFKVTCDSEEVPSLYAYKVDERNLSLTAQNVYDEGIKSVPKDEYSVSNLEIGKEYTLYVTAQVGGQLAKVATADFVSEKFDSSSDNAISVRIDNKTHNSLTYSLVSGKNVTKGYMTVLPKAWLNNYYYESLVDGITEADLISDLLLSGYGLEVVGEEKYAKWTATPIVPNADYTICIQAMTGDESLGEVTMVDFSSGELAVIGDPTLNIEIVDKNYMSAYFKYTINKDSYGYTRFVTNKSEIDEYLEHFTEDDLREFLRFIDGTWESLGQKWDAMPPSTDGGETKSKDESINFGWDQGGLEFSALGVAFDKNLSVADKYARLDGKLETVPVGTEKAKFTCYLKDPSATTMKIHFDFEDNCAKAYCNVVPSDAVDQYLENQKEMSRILWYDGWRVYRESDSPDSPIANQDDLWMDLSPDTEYCIVATAINFEGVLNEEIYVSEPLTTKSLTYGNSEASVTVETVKTGKLQATLLYKATDQTVEYYHMILVDTDPLLSETEEVIRETLMEHGNKWAWLGEKDADWDSEYNGVIWTWTGMDPDTDYVSLVCAQDTEGRVGSVSRMSFSTLPLTSGPNPDFTMNVFDVTENSFKMDLIVNDDVSRYLLMIIEDELAGIDENTTEDEISDILYNGLLTNGMEGFESIEGQEVNQLPTGLYYIAAIAYGEAPAEKFKYTSVNLNDAVNYVGRKSELKMLPGGEKKSFASMKEHNIALSPNPLSEEGVIYVFDRQDAENTLKQMGYTPVSLKQLMESSKELFKISK